MCSTVVRFLCVSCRLSFAHFVLVTLSLFLAAAATLSFRPYTVKWTGNFAKSFVEIDLYYCGSDCQEVPHNCIVKHGLDAVNC